MHYKSPKRHKFHLNNIIKTNISCLKHPSQTWKFFGKKTIPIVKQRLRK